MSDDPFAPLPGGGAAASQPKPRVWVPIVPVPADAPKPPASHRKHGKPVAAWCYRDANGAVLGYVARFQTPDGKMFQPLTYAKPADGSPQWRWLSWAPKRPLYGLDRLAARPDAVVVVTEGEKAADAAEKLLPEIVAVTSPNGSKSADKADWSALRSRRVVIWPDADSAGRDYALAVVKHLAAVEAESVAIISPPAGCKVGWDADDARVDGWDEARAKALLAEALPAPNGGSEGERRRARTPQRDQLVALTDACEFWHDEKRDAYVTMPVNSHREHWPVRSRDFRMWLSSRFYKETGGAIGSQALEDSIRILEAHAVNDGPLYDHFVRVGRSGQKLYLDLCDKRWRCVEMTGTQWRVVDVAPVKFLRSASMKPLPEPEAGGFIEELRSFINASEDQYMLVVAWLVGALRDRGPYPVLVVNGEQGSGKSVVSRMLRLLIDPSRAPIRAAPKDDRDLIISAGNGHAICFDNLSNVPGWLADALCRLSTGGGFATRTLHTDREETIFEGQKAILCNGIPSLLDRADLADRALTIHLYTIPEQDRRTEDDLWIAFEAAQPRILGALLDAVCAALRNLATTKLDRTVRMADFEKWITAAEPALGWDRGAFGKALRDNRRDNSESTFEADPVAVAIRDAISNATHPDGWSGTATELLALLNNRAPEAVKKSRIWPTDPARLGSRVDRIAPLLRAKGFMTERRRSGVRTIIIVPPKNAA